MENPTDGVPQKGQPLEKRSKSLDQGETTQS